MPRRAGGMASMTPCVNLASRFRPDSMIFGRLSMTPCTRVRTMAMATGSRVGSCSASPSTSMASTTAACPWAGSSNSPDGEAKPHENSPDKSKRPFNEEGTLRFGGQTPCRHAIHGARPSNIPIATPHGLKCHRACQTDKGVNRGRALTMLNSKSPALATSRWGIAGSSKITESLYL